MTDRFLGPYAKTRRLGLAGSAVALLSCLAGCARLPMVASAGPGDYRLDAGDTIQVSVYDQKDLSGAFMLDSAGRVSLLRAGVVPLRGQTLREAERQIAESLKGELKNPEVTVNMVEYRPVFVSGEVQRPGKFPVASGITVLKAVALANGYTPRGDRGGITIVREGQPRSRADEDTPLQPGDVVDVGERLF